MIASRMMLRLSVFSVLLALLASVFPALAQETTPEAGDGAMEGAIVIQRADFTPEGIEYSPESEQFLVGSIAEGTVYAIADDGTATPFIEDEDLKASLGIRVDAANNRLLVTNSDPSVLGNPQALGSAMLGIYDLTTGERLYMVDLGVLYPDGKHLANDVTVDADGNAYVTDSFSPVIYKVDMEGNASLFLQNDQFVSDTFGLNGIAYNADGYLVVAVTGAGALFKVPLDAPEELTAVTLESPLGVDGMVFDENGTLFAVGGGETRSVLALTSEDDWASATVDASVPANQTITTLTLREDEVNVLYTSFSPVAPIGTYQIVPVDLGE